jgi:hypothetical protein
LDSYETAALEKVNALRTRLGGPRTPRLAPGRRNRPGSCAIARSVEAARPDLVCTVRGGAIEVRRLYSPGHKPLSEPLGMRVDEFVRRFDRGDYPHLDLDQLIEREGH